MFRTIRCLVMVMLLLAVAVPAVQAREVATAGEPALESPGLWSGILSWVSALFTGGGPFIDPNGRNTTPVGGDGGRLAQEDDGALIRLNP